MSAPRPRLRRPLLAVGWAFALAGTALMLLYVIPDLQLSNRYTSMAAAFIPYGLLAWLAATVIFLAAGPRWAKLIALATAACLIVQFTWTEPYWPRRPAGSGVTLTVLTLNLRCNPAKLADLVAEVNRVRPTVVVLEDVARKEQKALGGAPWPLPYSYYLPMRPLRPKAGTPPCGTLVYADGPLSRVSATEPDAEATLRADLPSGPLTIIPVDAANPQDGVADWAADLAAVHAATATQLEQPLIVVGDFNAVLEHLPMRRLLHLGLSDAAEQAGAGWLPTFPARGLPTLFAIDHVLMSPSLRASLVETFRVGDADHLGLVARLER